MRIRSIATALLLPAAALATALPANASGVTDTSRQSVMHAQAVATQVSPSAGSLRALRSSTQKCAGNVLEKVVVRTNGKSGSIVGELDVYATPSNGGTVIACFKHVGLTKGLRLPTTAVMGGAKTPAGLAKPLVTVTAYGNFTSWAGPAAIGGANGKCVQAAGAVQYKGKAYVAESNVFCSK